MTDDALYSPLTLGSISFTVVASLTTQQSAIRMLSDRISLCLSYVKAVRQGQAPRDPETLRSIKAILAGMPAMDSAEFKEEFLREYNDVLLTGYLASLTKGMNSLNEVSSSLVPQTMTQRMVELTFPTHPSH